MIKEESDYRDLESVVQQVEQNLELMTVRGAGGHCDAPGVTLCRQPTEARSEQGSLTMGPPAGQSSTP